LWVRALSKGCRLAQVSFETADLMAPTPTYAAVTGKDMKRHYGDSGDWDGRFLLVSAVGKDVLDAYRVTAETWGDYIFLPFQNPVVHSPPNFPAIIYRQQLPNNRLNTSFAHPSVYSLLRSCNGDLGKCNDIEYVSSFMGDYYPMLEVYKCDRARGTLKRLSR
jgi:hypothetical protein